jgi:PmbA protein
MSAGAKRISDTLAELAVAARKLLALAERAGAEEAEVFGLSGRSVDVDLRKDEVELASESFSRGLGIRAVVKGAVGFSSTSDLSKLEAVAKSAVRSARARGPDLAWKSLPSMQDVSRPEAIFDRALDGMRPEDCIDFASSMLEGCRSVPGAEPVSGGVGCSTGEEIVINSHGLEHSEAGTAIHGSMEAIARGADVVTGSEFLNFRVLKDEFFRVGKEAAEMAVLSLGGEKAKTGTYQVLLRPIAFTDLLEYAFLPSFSGDSVLKGRSPLAENVGLEVASPHLSLIDDGLLPGGMGSSAFDGEGVPTRRNVLVEGGILKGFLYDSYTAGRAGTASTGNAVRGGYSDIPRIGVRNLSVQSSESFDLLGETAEGILVNGFIGSHTANPISGDFSVECRNAFYIKGGELVRPIRSAMMAGNIFDLMKEITVGTDPRAIGAVITPTIGFSMKVVGS